ncbi:MAG: ribonuclease R [Bacteroidia bacterium]|nr:ribonuclease R [Bacteroidia bacterium]
MAGKSKKKDKAAKKFLLEDVLRFFAKSPGKLNNYKQVCAGLEITDSHSRLQVMEILEALERNGQLTEPEPGRFRFVPTASSVITGRVDMTQSGAGYILSDDTPEEIYISAVNMGSALHGDLVRVQLFARRKGRKPDGEIIEVIERNRTEFVGIVQLSKKFAFVVPDSNKMPIDIFVPLNDLNGAKDGDKVQVKIVDWPPNAKNPFGEVTLVLGRPGENQVEMHAIMLDFNLPFEFPQEVIDAASTIPMEIPQAEIEKRRDFRKITTFTIDPVDAKDFDDALSLQELPNGNWEIGVHIADVSFYVKPDSILEREAFRRATSVYLVDRVVAMLPEHLSNGVCSLRPDEEKLCFSAVFEMDNDANIVQQWFGRTVIRSNRRFTYEEAQTVIETGKGDFSKEILLLNDLAVKLRKRRFQKGSIAFDKVEVKFNLDAKGKPLGVYFKVQKEAHQLIEDFMLLANRSVAALIGDVNQVPAKGAAKGQTKKIRPFVYRIHDRPDPEKLTEFGRFVAQFGYKVKFHNPNQVSDSLNQLMKDIKGKGEENVIETLAIRTMAKATYSTKNIGHYGLAFPFYTHFTSPIRRYPDVMVHRLLELYLHEQKGETENELEARCKHSSEMEKRAADAERASVKYKQVEFLKDKIGEEFEGVISGVTEWGIFVEITENKCEGLVRMRDIKDDMYFFDQDSYSIIGRRYKKRYRLGDTVRVEIKRADLVKKQLDFALLSDDF